MVDHSISGTDCYVIMIRRSTNRVFGIKLCLYSHLSARSVQLMLGFMIHSLSRVLISADTHSQWMLHWWRADGM